MNPTLTRRLLAEAEAALACGRLTDTAKTCRDVLQTEPANLRARLLLARTKLAASAAAAAVRQLADAIERDPNCERSLLMMAVAEHRQGNTDKAFQWSRRAASLEQASAATISSHGFRCLESEEWEEAEDCFRRASNAEPSKAEHYDGLGISLRQRGQTREALPHFRRAVELEPSSTTYRANLADALISQNDLEVALENAEELKRLEPTEPIGYLLAAECLVAMNGADEAEGQARKAIDLRPGAAPAHASLASIHLALGRMAEAVLECRKSLDLEPKQGVSYFNLVKSKRVSAEDRPLIEEMEALHKNSKLPIGQRALLAYALGKALEDVGDYERSMAYYDEANALDYRKKFGDVPFDPAPVKALHRDMAATYDKGFLAANRCKGTASDIPIFVFGMMRSGTTLLEQILSSHPAVGGAGEQHFWSTNRFTALARGSRNLDHSTLDELARGYVSMLAKAAPRKRLVVDKMPTNYLNLGLLQLAFPNAPMIHVRRNPADIGLSIYTTYNRIPIGWTFRKDQIAENIGCCLELMRHWIRVFPKGRIFEVQYEDLVANPTPVIESLLSYCLLPWSDRCLHPEQNERSVTTPSVWQVRQPIYRTSVARWKRFEPWLEELASLSADPEPLRAVRS